MRILDENQQLQLHAFLFTKSCFINLDGYKCIAYPLDHRQTVSSETSTSLSSRAQRQAYILPHVLHETTIEYIFLIHEACCLSQFPRNILTVLIWAQVRNSILSVFTLKHSIASKETNLQLPSYFSHYLSVYSFL